MRRGRRTAGRLAAREQLLQRAVTLHGDINTKKLSIEPGAAFTGSCSMGSGAVIKDLSDAGRDQGRETEQRKKTLIVLDDAQTVEESLLEDLRLLTNFEFDSCEPLALVLIGHPSLQNRLRKPIHLALWDRLRMLYRLEGLSLDETRQYVDRHLESAGGRVDLFTDEAKVALFDHSQGIPRRINRLALQAVKLSARNKVTTIDDKLISLAEKVFHGV